MQSHTSEHHIYSKSELCTGINQQYIPDELSHGLGIQKSTIRLQNKNVIPEDFGIRRVLPVTQKTIF